MKGFCLFFLAILLFTNIFAQKQESIREDWLAKDIENIKLVSKILPIENKSLEKLEQSFHQEEFVNEEGAKIEIRDPSESFGFGYKQFSYQNPGGYCHVFVEGFVFENNYAYYKFGVNCSSDKWKRIRKSIIEAWRKNSETKFEENEGSIFIERKFDAVFQDYKNAVNKELGEIKPAKVPSNLSEYYDYLISPMRNSVIGNGGCDYAGVTPQGKEAIDLFIEAKRIDLLENILRGYNPGGRVYALIALTRMKNKGVTLSSETLQTMEKVLNLEIEIEICQGCIHSYHNTKEILENYGN